MGNKDERNEEKVERGRQSNIHHWRVLALHRRCWVRRTGCWVLTEQKERTVRCIGSGAHLNPDNRPLVSETQSQIVFEKKTC